MVAERQAKRLFDHRQRNSIQRAADSFRIRFTAGRHRRTRLRSTGSPATARMPIFVQGALHGVNETRLGIDDARDRDRCEPAPGPRRDARLGNAGIAVCAVETAPGAPSFASRWCAESAVIPDFARDPDAYIDSLIERLRPAPAASADPVPRRDDRGASITPGTMSSGWSRWRWRRRRPWPPRSTSGRPWPRPRGSACECRGGDRNRRGRGRRRAG